MAEYKLRMMATARVAGFATIEADTDGEALAKAAKIDADEFEFRLDEDFGIEGDEVVFVPYQDDLELVPPEGDCEVDARKPGEPFSWDCVQLVKDLAKADPSDDAALRDFVARAGSLLKEKPVE